MKKKNTLGWKNIQQKAFTRTASKEGMRRKWRFWLRTGAVLLGVALVLSGSLWWGFRQWNRTEAESTWGHDTHMPLHHLQLVTNGMLTETWARSVLNLPADVSLASLDLQRVKTLLANVPQVKHVVVSKQFPDTLHIQIEEYVPIARIAVRIDRSRTKLFVVSPEGAVYYPACYPRSTLNHLPFLDGVKVRESQGKWLPIERMPIVAELLELARKDKPHLYAYWQVVSCASLDAEPDAPWSLIAVKTKYHGQIIFAPKDFGIQLSRLDSIIQEISDKKMGPVKKIDLSLGDHAVVQGAGHSQYSRK